MIRVRTAAITATAALFVLGGAACGSSSDEETAAPTTETTAPAGPVISVDDPWCRASPAMASAGACYMVVTNTGTEDDALVGVSVPADLAPTAELHETVPVEDADMDGEGDGHTDDTAGDGSMGDEPMADDSTATSMVAGFAPAHTDDTAGEDDEHMGGEMTMQEVASIPVPAGGEAVLEPGGYHVMLLDLVAPLEVGQTVPLTLELESGDTVEVDAEVRTG